jgi:hypothetical protein
MNIIEFSEGLLARMRKELDMMTTDQDEIINTGKLLQLIRGLTSKPKTFTRS